MICRPSGPSPTFGYNSNETKIVVDEYARNHIATDDWHFAFFNFIDDKQLADRLGEEF